MVAWNRLVDDHLYWTAVIQPRWRETPNWEIYLRVIAGTDDIPPPCAPSPTISGIAS